MLTLILSVFSGNQMVACFSSESLQEYDRPVVKTPIPGPRSKVQVMYRLQKFITSKKFLAKLTTCTNTICFASGVKVLINGMNSRH